MKTLSKLLLSFVLLGSLVSCGSDGGSSGSSSNAGSTDSGSVISNQCTTNLKEYIVNYSDMLYFYYNRSTSVKLSVAVAEAEKIKNPYTGQEFYQTVSVKRESDISVQRGATKNFLNEIAAKANSCTENYTGFIVKVGKTQYFIARNLPLEVNPVEQLTEVSSTEYEYKVVEKFTPNNVNEISFKDVWDKIF